MKWKENRIARLMDYNMSLDQEISLIFEAKGCTSHIEDQKAHPTLHYNTTR